MWTRSYAVTTKIFHRELITYVGDVFVLLLDRCRECCDEWQREQPLSNRFTAAADGAGEGEDDPGEEEPKTVVVLRLDHPQEAFQDAVGEEVVTSKGSRAVLEMRKGVVKERVNRKRRKGIGEAQTNMQRS